MKRVFLIVLDSCGVGALPDAAAFGDAGCNTLRRISASPAFDATNMRRLGLGNIDGVNYIGGTDTPLAAVARLAERSMGKDTTIGHWEIAGVVSPRALPTYPDGFPPEIIEAFKAATGRGVLCNKPYSGTEVIKDYGQQHLDSGDLIVYTSADSVFQIAAHEGLVPPEQLYDYCRIVRQILCGEHAVGRVIARPFVGEAPNFTRTANRRDFSVEAPRETLLDVVAASGHTVYAVGKIADIFAGRGVTRSVLTHSNAEGMDAAMKALSEEFTGLCFINLVDFDMLYGHRQDVDGYAAAFAAFDRWLPDFLARLGDEDVLFITADHGCDPGDDSTDHSREYVPLLMGGNGVHTVNLGTRTTFADIGATVAEILGVPFACDGESFWQELKRTR